MDFSIFDLIMGSIVLLLGLKGIFNGFFKELFGLLGIVGGIFIGSRIANDVGSFLSNAIFKFDSPAAINFLGFLVSLAAFWGAMLGIGILFKKFSNLSGLGFMDKLLGFIFGSGKFFFIASVIVFAIYNFKAVRDNFNMEGSIMFPALVETGRFIMQIDGSEVVDDINNSIDKGVKSAKGVLEDEAAKKILEAATQDKNAIIEVVNKKLEESNISLKNGSQ